MKNVILLKRFLFLLLVLVVIPIGGVVAEEEEPFIRGVKGVEGIIGLYFEVQQDCPPSTEEVCYPQRYDAYSFHDQYLTLELFEYQLHPGFYATGFFDHWADPGDEALESSGLFFAPRINQLASFRYHLGFFYGFPFFRLFNFSLGASLTYYDIDFKLCYPQCEEGHLGGFLLNTEGLLSWFEIHTSFLLIRPFNMVYSKKQVGIPLSERNETESYWVEIINLVQFSSSISILF